MEEKELTSADAAIAEKLRQNRRESNSLRKKSAELQAEEKESRKTLCPMFFGAKPCERRRVEVKQEIKRLHAEIQKKEKEGADLARLNPSVKAAVDRAEHQELQKRVDAGRLAGRWGGSAGGGRQKSNKSRKSRTP